jgi:3'-5' exoribonuclease
MSEERKKIEAENILGQLKAQSISFGVRDLCYMMLSDKKFLECSGSGKKGQHHYGEYGLIKHTSEVVNYCLTMANHVEYPIDEKILFLGALFHDYGKTYDYERGKYQGQWQKTQHARRIHHISRSALLWQRSCDAYFEIHGERPSDPRDEMEITEDEVDLVTHIILSHHGRREWGSPVAPNTREAWMVHLCDGMSARLNDCETLDRLD